MKKKQSTLSISSSDLEISDPPKDTISSLKFSIIDNILLSTSWDNNLYVYKIDKNKSLENQIEKDITQFNESLIATQVFSNPQLDCAFEGNDINYFYSVGLDSDIKRIDLELLSSTIIGSHQQPINKVVYDNSHQCVFTTGWDGYLKRFDHRQNYNGMLTITEINLEMISSGITLSNESLIIAGFDNMYNHIVKIFDVRNLNNISKVYESPLKFQTSSICSNNKGDGFVMGSIEGKICVEYLEQQESIHTQSTTPINKNYAFKCHREETESQTFIYPVNCLSYHCSLNIFFSGGSDKHIYAWDADKKKKVYKSSQYENAITACSLNKDGSLLAIASSENKEDLNFSVEQNHLNKHKIFIKEINF